MNHISKLITFLLVHGGTYKMPTLAELNSQKVGAWGTMNNSIIDPNIQPSVAGVFTPTYAITRVSGTAAITGLTVPFNGFHGKITLIPTGIFTWTTATNIGLAGTAVVGKALDFTYDPYSAKWYPSYTA